MLTVLETAVRQGLDIRAYLHDVLVQISGGFKLDRLEELLPENWTAAPSEG